MDILTWEPWLDPWRLNSPNFMGFLFQINLHKNHN